MFTDIASIDLFEQNVDMACARVRLRSTMVITGIAVKLDSRSALSPLASCYTYKRKIHHPCPQHRYHHPAIPMDLP